MAHRGRKTAALTIAAQKSTGQRTKGLVSILEEVDSGSGWKLLECEERESASRISDRMGGIWFPAASKSHCKHQIS